MQTITVQLNQIKIGYNPRKYFNPAKMEEMEQSVRAQGILQPVLIRPIGEGEFELVAGARRYRAAMAVHGENYYMPVVIKELSDAEAKAAALVENIQREDMSPAEEAISAAEHVGLLKGDRDETARIFGWTRTTLDRRLALMNCSPAVLESLTVQEIQLGHAELLAALSKENQDRILPVIISEKRSVADIKKVIETASCSLASAIFDKAECAACPHNSSTQSEMFGESIATGNCTNRACFSDKTDKQLEVVAAGMRDEYPVVRIVRAGDNHTRVQLVVDGPKGVGEEQGKACHACQSYGVAVSALPDSLGKVYRGQCFDTVCNMKKVAANIQATAAANASTAPKGRGAPVAKAAGATQKAESSAAVTAVAESDRVKEYRVAMWRKALRRDIGSNADLARAYLIGVVLTGNARKIDEQTFRSIYERISGEKPEILDVGKAIAATLTLPDDNQAALMIAMSFAALQGVEVIELVRICKHHKLDLAKHWKLSKDFLELITKSEMMVVADELGIRKALGENFKKVFAKSKPELIEALLSVPDFDYVGKIPKVLKF